MGDTRSDGISEGKPLTRSLSVGDRYNQDNAPMRRTVWLELTFFWLAVMLGIRSVVLLQSTLGLPDWILGLVPLLFIYAPVWLCKYRKADSWSYHLSIPAFRDFGSWWAAAKLNFWMNMAVWPWFIPLYHVYNTHLFGKTPMGILPQDLVLIVAYQFFFVAIPEEFFYRGYFQTRLNEIFPRRFLIFGVPMGWGAVWASLYFAFGHSLVQFQWWHFATFFPGLIFAWMREKRNGVLSGAMFHACCNIGIVILDTMYGLRSPI
ncbi:MAG: type II CAAX endopeptidase family protein [Myxococcota bacterium]|nr:type II CAAX endopeptidase family protein [Myxococcota bacterium]